MAVALESFSIREYAAKMRIVDFGKCWPFRGDGEGTREGEMGRSLPPISFRKYRWWFDELETELSVGEKPDGAAEELQFERALALTEEGSRRRRTPVKAKQRAPKKRSIVELFAVSPQIEAVDDETYSGDEQEGKREAVEDGEREKEVGGEDGGRKESSGVGGGDGASYTDVSVSSPRKSKERVKEMAKTRKRSWMTYKNKKKKSYVETCAAEKGKNYRPKTSYSGGISQLLHDSVSKKRPRKGLGDAAYVRKKKPSTVQSLLKKQNRKVIQNSRLLCKDQEEVAKVLPVHGILKNCSKASSIEESSLIVDIQGGNSSLPSRASEKHVTFSGKDDLLGHDKGFSPMELPQLQSQCRIFSDVLAASSAMGDLSEGDKFPSPSKGSHVVNECEKDVETSGAEGTAGCDKAQLSDAHSPAVPHDSINPHNSTCPDRDIPSLDEAVDLNSVVGSSSNSNCLHTGNSVLSGRDLRYGNQQVLNSYGKEGSSSGERIFRTSNSRRSLSTPMETSASRSEAMSSPTGTRNPTSQPLTTSSVTSTEANERQPQLSLGPRFDVDRCVSEIQPMCHLTRKDFKGSICTSVGLKRSGETGLMSISTCRDKYRDENLIGLPLNSRGELVKFHSRGKFGFRNLFKEQNTVLGSCHSFPISSLAEPRSTLNHVNMKAASGYMKDGLRWYPEQFDNPVSMPATSGLSMTQLHGFERMEVQNHASMRDKDQHFHHGPSSTKVSCNGWRDSSHQACNWNNWEKFQAEGNLYHGVQPANQPTMRLMGKNVTVGRKSEECSFDYGKIWTDKETITDTSLPRGWLQQGCFKQPVSEASRFTQTIGASSSIYRSPALEPRFDHMDFDCPEKWISRNGLPSPNGDYASKLNPSSHPPSWTMLNTTLNPTLNSATEHVEVGRQIPFVATHPPSIQHILLMSTHCKHSQSFSFGTSSTSHPAFLSQNCGNFVESSSAQSSLCRPHWLTNAEQHKRSNKFPSPICSDPIATCHPSTTSGSKLPLLPSPYPTFTVSSPVYNTRSLHTRGSSSLIHSSFIPSYPASKSTFPGNANFRNKNKERDGTKSKLTYLKTLDRANRSNKRPAAKADGFMRPVKTPHLTIRDNSVPAGPRREELNDCSSDDARSAETSAFANNTIVVGRPVMSNEKNGSDYSVGTRSGTVKLSSGAKHILKPSQNRDRDNSGPIHSTIPFAVGTSSCAAPVSQKSSIIYRF